MPDQPASERSRTVKWEDPRPGARRAKSLSGEAFFDKMRRGEIAAPPFVHLLGMEVFDSGKGRFTMTLEPQECHYNPMGCVHGGVISTLLDSVMSAAVHTALPAGQGYMTLEIKVNFLRPIFVQTGEVMAMGNVLAISHHVAAAEGKVVDVQGRVLATGTATCLIFDVSHDDRRRRERDKNAQEART